MSDKQTLQSQIASLKNVLASPKTDGTTRKILESGLRKAEAKLEELEKAEKLEASKKELTPKQEAKVEETKKESKSLAEALKQKVKQAKQKIATTTPKATKKGGARSVARAKELAKQMRSTQKKQSLKDSDIESDANRYAINKTKRKSHGGRANQYGTKAENKGGTYYEKRENRYDRQNKRYAKLEGGGSTDGKNGYVAFYKGKRIEVYADTMYQAQKKAAEIFKAKKSWEVNVALAEVDGKQYVHNAYSHGGETYAKGGQVSGYFKFVPYKKEGGFFVSTTLQNVSPENVMRKGVEGKLKGDTLNSAEYIATVIMQQHPEVYKLDIVKQGASVLKNKVVASFVRESYDDNTYTIQYFEDGGAINDFGGSTYSTEDLSGMFAKGGMTEHGLRVGDKIIGGKIIGTTIRVHNENYNEDARVDLNTGKRTILHYDSKTKKWEDKMEYGGNTSQGTRFSHSKDPMAIKKKFEQGGINDFGGTKYSTEDLSGMFEHGGRLKGSNAKTGETYGVVIGSHKKSDEYVKGGTEMNVRKSYGSRISEVKLIFDSEGNLHEIIDYGYSLDGYPSTSGGSGHSYNADKKETLKVLSEKYNPSFAKKLIDSVTTKMGMGGKTTFDDKVSAISKKLKGKKVAPSVQKDYGKRYSKDEAIDSAKRIAGAMRKKELAKKKS